MGANTTHIGLENGPEWLGIVRNKMLLSGVTLLDTWSTFFFFFLTDMYLYDHMTSTHMTTYLYNRTILSGTPLFPPFVCVLLFSSYGSL